MPNNFGIERIGLDDVRDLCERYHAYAGAGASATYAFGVAEHGRIVAAFSWQPPPRGSALAVNPHAPSGVLSLSRMVAVPKEEREIKHISKPLQAQMKRLIDRTRWPSLVTYSDEGLGHTGYVYQCSGWTPTVRSLRPQYEDSAGRRSSTYRNGKHDLAGLRKVGVAIVQRWEHHVVPPEESPAWMAQHGWMEIAVPGRRWRSGNDARTIARDGSVAAFLARLPSS